MVLLNFAAWLKKGIERALFRPNGGFVKVMRFFSGSSVSKKFASVMPGAAGYRSIATMLFAPTALRAAMKLPFPAAGSRKLLCEGFAMCGSAALTREVARSLGV